MVKCYQITTPFTGTLMRGWWQGWYQQNDRVWGGHPREMQRLLASPGTPGLSHYLYS